MEYDVFISYSRKDTEVADKIHKALEAEGINCFIDRAGISGGADFPTVLSKAITESKVMLFIASENSYKSEYTLKELTFAVSNKGSNFIFPLIVDDSSLPKNLEFLLSNINWRVLSSSYRIEKEMTADIKAKLEDPHAGETLKQQERRSFRKLMYIVYSVVALLVIGLSVILVRNWKERQAQQMAEQQAISDSRLCAQLCKNAREQIARADSLRDCRNELGTLNSEVSCLQKADSLLFVADSLRRSYQEKPVYAYLFQSVSPANLASSVKRRLDSMFYRWNNTAIELYGEYEMYNDDINRQVAAKYVDYALRIRPEDKSLLTIKESLK